MLDKMNWQIKDTRFPSMVTLWPLTVDSPTHEDAGWKPGMPAGTVLEQMVVYYNAEHKAYGEALVAMLGLKGAICRPRGGVGQR